MFRHIQNRFKKLIGHGRNVLVWGLLTALLVGVTEIGAPADEVMQSIRNKARSYKASGEIVVIGIDALSEKEVSEWPWTNEKLADLVVKLDQAGAKRIFFDFPVNEQRSASNNAAFVSALDTVDADVFLNARLDLDKESGNYLPNIPPALFRKHADIVSSNFRLSVYNTAPSLPYSLTLEDTVVPSIASDISGQKGSPLEEFPVDYAVDIYSIPYLSAADIFSGQNIGNDIAGKDIIIGINNVDLTQQYWIMGAGPKAPVFISAIGAETLKHGKPISVGWAVPLAIAILLAWLTNKVGNKGTRRGAKLLLVAFVLTVPTVAEAHGYFLSIFPALFFLGLFAAASMWSKYNRSYRLRGTINPVSGMPNLTALHESAETSEYALVAARVQNYVEVATTLPSDAEGAFVKQITNRLVFGTSGETLFQGDEGIFFWRVPADQREMLTDQLSALQAIFRNPVPVGENRYDLDISFGIDVDTERSLSSRMSSALLAAQGAHSSGEHWKFYDPSHQQATAWKLSMLGELDNAIDNGELWVAFQPKLDLRSNTIIGAEALVRWTHPTKGDISPEDFVLAAEKHNRIHKLTEFVLSEALTLAHEFNQSGIDFDISVNLSPRLLDQPGLSEMIDRVFSGRSLGRDKLILEVTETAAISSSEDAMRQLKELRDMGIGISIDDYGTGFSTLDYLKKCPAGEVKIDRSFVSTLVQSNSDRIMVNSTIELAHSLGQIVVAEGVEDKQTLSQLKDMKCDIVQGYLIGRPMQFPALQKFMIEFGEKAAKASQDAA